MKEKENLIRWSNLIISGGGLLDIGNKINQAQKSDRMYGKYKGNHGKWIYWSKIKIASLPDSHKKHFIDS